MSDLQWPTDDDDSAAAPEDRDVHVAPAPAVERERSAHKERFAVLGQLASGVAHQIRNPLAAIMNATYVLERHITPDQHVHVRDAIRIIHDEVRHANLIITGLLDYAKLREPTCQSTDVRELVERVLTNGWVPPNVRVESSIDDIPLVEIDGEQIHGAVLHLVRNAIDAMPDGGTLFVDTKVEGSHVVIGVTDTGPGISGQVRDHLFEPLHSTKPMGLGLGLVTARTIVEAHGGRIARVSVPNGTRFEVRLPLASRVMRAG